MHLNIYSTICILDLPIILCVKTINIFNLLLMSYQFDLRGVTHLNMRLEQHRLTNLKKLHCYPKRNRSRFCPGTEFFESSGIQPSWKEYLKTTYSTYQWKSMWLNLTTAVSALESRCSIDTNHIISHYHLYTVIIFNLFIQCLGLFLKNFHLFAEANIFSLLFWKKVTPWFEFMDVIGCSWCNDDPDWIE